MPSVTTALAAATMLFTGNRFARRPGVTIERDAPMHWRATYEFGAPITGLRFERPASFFRERCWTVLTSGYRLTRDGQSQVLQLDSGAQARATLAFGLAQCTETIPKEYEQFLPFTDGAVAIYTGHFYARAAGPGLSDTDEVRTVRIVPPPGSQIVADGRVVRGALSWTDSIGEGTYVYLGPTRPISTSEVVAVLDPGMPAWLTDMLDQALPRLFERYTALLGTRLPWKPVVFYSFDDDTAVVGLNSSGGTLPRFLNVTLSGRDWRTETPAAAEQAFGIIAHESAHLWNGQLVRSDSAEAGAWIHEGSADAMANEMLLALGIIDSARARARRDEALNRCAEAIRSQPIDSAIARHQVREVYDCGFVMAMWTGAVRGPSPGVGLFRFWRDLITAGKASGGRYDRELYFATLARGGAADSTVGAMRRFIASRDSFGIVVRGLGAARVPVRADSGDPPRAHQLELASQAVAHLMAVACHRVNLFSGDPVRTGVVAGCAPFERPLVVARIQGLRVSDQGAKAYDAVIAACRSHQPVALGGTSGEMLGSVECSRPPAERLPWFSMDFR